MTIRRFKESYSPSIMDIVEKMNEIIEKVNEIDNQNPAINMVPLTPLIVVTLSNAGVLYTSILARPIK